MTRKTVRWVKRKCKKLLKGLWSIAFILSICMIAIFIDVWNDWGGHCIIWLSAMESELIYSSNEKVREELRDICIGFEDSGNDFIIFTEYDKWKKSDVAQITNKYIKSYDEALNVLNMLQPDDYKLEWCDSFIRNYIIVQSYYDVMDAVDPECDEYYYIMYSLQRDVTPHYPYLMNKAYRILYYDWEYLLIVSLVVIFFTIGIHVGRGIKCVFELIREYRSGRE